MASSTTSSTSSTSHNAGNWQHEKSDTDVKTREGSFRRHLINPIKNATRYIIDGTCTLCRRIRLFLIRICTPLSCCACLQKKERTDSNAGLQESVSREKEDSTPRRPENHEAEGKSEISHFLTSHDVALSSSQLQGAAAAREDAEIPPEIFNLTSHNASPYIESERLRNVRDRRPNRNRSRPDPDSGKKRHERSSARPIRKKISSAKKWVKTNFKSCKPHKKPSPQNTLGPDRQRTFDQVMTRL